MLDHDLGSRLAVRAGLAPVAGTGTAQNGPWIDTQGFGTAMAVVPYSTAGGVTGGTVSVQFQDATSNAGAGAANFDTATVKTIGAGPNEANVVKHARDIRGSRRFIRTVVTIAASGGTPTSIAGSSLVLANPYNLPVT